MTTRHSCRSALAHLLAIGQSDAVTLTKSFAAEQYAEALESWDWIGLEGKSPIFASLFGDLFLTSDEGYWYLDTRSGDLQRAWDDESTLNAALETAQGKEEYLLSSLAREAERAGMVLDATSIYDFTVAPILGGPIDLRNLATTDFVVGVNIAGQIHEQVRNHAPGTKVGAVTVDGKSSKTKHRK